jgi:hypothetical protein
MLRFITRRRRIEDARVERFLHAIELSGRYSVSPDWELRPVPDESRTDTVGFPRILLAGTVL